MDIDDEFRKNTTTRKTKDGYSVRCRKGLWGVNAPTKEEALQNARYYFIQYFSDGEYRR